MYAMRARSFFTPKIQKGPWHAMRAHSFFTPKIIEYEDFILLLDAATLQPAHSLRLFR